MKFEEQLSRLDTILEKLEEENLPLDDSLSLYEEGIRLIRECTEKLEDAEKKIQELAGQNQPAK